MNKAWLNPVSLNRRAITAGLALAVALSGSAALGEEAGPDPAPAKSGQEMLDELNRDAEALSRAAERHLKSTTQRSEALGELAKSIDFLMTQLDEARANNGRLRTRIASLTDELERARAQAAILESEPAQSDDETSPQQVQALKTRAEENEARVDDLTAEMSALKEGEAALRSELAETQARLSDAERAAEASESRLRDVAANEDRAAALDQKNVALNEKLGGLELERERAAAKIGDQKRRLAELEAQLSTFAKEDKTRVEEAARAQQLRDEAADLKRSLSELNGAFEEAKLKAAAQEIEIAELTTELGEMRTREAQAANQSHERKDLARRVSELEAELAAAGAALKTSEAKVGLQQRQIDALNSEPKDDSAAQFAELKRYRSDFLALLRQVLGEQRDMAVTGDRFIVQADVLFETDSAELTVGAAIQLTKLADSLRRLEAHIPRNLPWILRVDGHTDEAPGRSDRYESNREFSTARALAVTNFLIGKGVSAPRLAATGFGEHRPIDPRNDEIAHRRNRRIEFRLTPP